MPEEGPKTTTEKEILKKLSTQEEGLVETEVQERLQTYDYNKIIDKKINPVLKFLRYFWGPIPKTISFQARNPREWFATYLRNRAHLASYKSAFQCDPTCTRPGCKNQDLQVPVSIVDLVGAAMYRDKSVSETYYGNYSLGLLSNEREDWIRIVNLRSVLSG